MNVFRITLSNFSFEFVALYAHNDSVYKWSFPNNFPTIASHLLYLHSTLCMYTVRVCIAAVSLFMD